MRRKLLNFPGRLRPLDHPGGLGGEPTVDGKNLATPGALGAQHFIKIQVFGGFEGSGGAWGHHQSTRDEKIPWGSYFREIWLQL